MPDATPILDASSVRRAVARAEHDVCDALRQVAALVGANDATLLSVAQRQAARTLDELGHEAARLRSVEQASSDAQMLERAHELKASADEITARLGELQAFAPRRPGEPHVPQPPLSAALCDLLDAIKATEHQLATAALDEHDPYAWTWDARLLSFALAGCERLFEQLVARVARSRVAMRAYNARQAASKTGDEADAIGVHLAAVPQRLHAAGRAAALAARRGNPIELHELVHNRPRVELQIDGTAIQISLNGRAPTELYELRANGRRFPDDFTYHAAEDLAAVIAAASGLDLGDLQQRRRARQAAERALRRLAAITAYRGSARRGDPQDAAGSPDPSAPQIADADRPDSREDLSDLLLDLASEQGPIATVLQDGLSIACEHLGDGDRERGITTLLAHPDDNPAAAGLLRRLVHT